jgi:hypothetical protein
MKTKLLFSILLCLFFACNVNAQFWKKLTKKAAGAAERTILNRTDKEVSETTDKAIDSVTKGGEKKTNSNTENHVDNIEFANPSLSINTEAKRTLYTTDVRVTSFDKEKNSEMTSYFDSEAVALRSHWIDGNTGNPKTSFTDSEGFFISYNEKEKRYVKSAILSMGGMSMMAPSMMAEAYKLPVNVIFEAMEDMQNNGLKAYPFMHVDFAFVLKPEHFNDGTAEVGYKESAQECRGNSGCTKFSITEQGYGGSYILFDDQDRLAEINTVMKDNPNFGSGQGKIEYFYEPCEVQVPAAIEKKMPGQDLLNMGLDPNKN